jgi:hypothetical protein
MQRVKLTNVNARGADFGMTDFSRVEARRCLPYSVLRERCVPAHPWRVVTLYVV